MNDDLISRQAAIDVFRQLADDDWNRRTGASWADGYESAIEILEDIPVAQERKKGEWERTEDEYGDFLCWECSECGERYVLPHHRASYCPNCGADMRGEEDESMD